MRGDILRIDGEFTFSKLVDALAQHSDDEFAELIAEKVYRKLEAADDAREAAARPPDQCPTCGESGVEYTTHSDVERKFACKKGHGKWTAER